MIDSYSIVHQSFKRNMKPLKDFRMIQAKRYPQITEQ